MLCFSTCAAGEKRFWGTADASTGLFTIARFDGCGIFPAAIGVFFWRWRFAEFGAEGA